MVRTPPLGPLPDWPTWADRLGFGALVLAVALAVFAAVYAGLALGGELWP